MENLDDFVKKLKKKRISKQEIKVVVEKKVNLLLNQAKKEFKNNNLQMSKRFVKKAKRLAMRFRLKLDKKIKKSFCKHCFSVLVQGENCRVRLAKKRVIYYCLSCKRFMRFPYEKEKKGKTTKNTKK